MPSVGLGFFQNCSICIDPWWSLTEVADCLGVTKAAAYRLIESGPLVGYRFWPVADVVVKSSDLAAYQRQNAEAR